MWDQTTSDLLFLVTIETSYLFRDVILGNICQLPSCDVCIGRGSQTVIKISKHLLLMIVWGVGICGNWRKLSCREIPWSLNGRTEEPLLTHHPPSWLSSPSLVIITTTAITVTSIIIIINGRGRLSLLFLTHRRCDLSMLHLCRLILSLQLVVGGDLGWNMVVTW